MRFQPILIWILLLSLPCTSMQASSDAVYQLANQCYTFFRVQDGATYPANVNEANSKYFMKPSALGEFMIYHNSDKLVSAAGDAVLLYNLKPVHFKPHVIWEPKEVAVNQVCFQE